WASRPSSLGPSAGDRKDSEPGVGLPAPSRPSGFSETSTVPPVPPATNRRSGRDQFRPVVRRFSILSCGNAGNAPGLGWLAGFFARVSRAPSATANQFGSTRGEDGWVAPRRLDGRGYRLPGPAAGLTPARAGPDR